MFNIDSNKDIVFLDIEADHKNGTILQFGAIKYSSGKYWKVDWYSNPECKISPHVLDIIGRNKLNIIKSSENNKSVLLKIYKFIDNSYFVSFGDFDYTFLMSLFNKHFGSCPTILGFIDIQNEWKQLFNMKSSISLSDLADFFEINYNENLLHDAFIDAEILFKIYKKWYNTPNEIIITRMYKHRLEKENIIKYTEKINIDFEKEVVSSKNNGYILFDFISKKITNKESLISERLFISLRLISIEENIILENWAEDLSGCLSSNKDLYNHLLIVTLKKFLYSIQDKIILLNEEQIKDFKFISKLCLKYLNKRPINSYIIINGIEKFSDVPADTQSSLNDDLIRKWDNIFRLKKYLENKREE